MMLVYPVETYLHRVTVLYVYIMIFVYPCVDIFTWCDRDVCLHYDVCPCVDIFTRCDRDVCLHFDVCLSLCRYIYVV
jgi:hypothetical protein